ncbi:MAG: MarR family winged helix-turn-helix transcriptional regulator [Rhodoglobus sp.]
MTDAIVNSTAFKLHQATSLLDRAADQYLRSEHGIRYAPFLVLLMARVMGVSSQRAISDALDVSRASITQRVAQLTEAGLLAVEPDPRDSRANLVCLTAVGSTLVDAAWAGLESHQNGLDVGVDEAALVAQLDRIISNGRAL